MLGDCDCVVMGGPNFQHKFKHRVPKMVAKRDGLVGPRINLTVRKYVESAARRKRSAVVAAKEDGTLEEAVPSQGGAPCKVAKKGGVAACARWVPMRVGGARSG